MGSGCVKKANDFFAPMSSDRPPRFLDPTADWCFARKPKVEYIFRANMEPDAPPGQGQDAIDTFAQLCIDDETINLLYTKFMEIDVDRSGEIDLEEFYQFFNIDRTPFGDRCFAIMDEDGSGRVDFREFTVCVWNYCSYNLTGLVKFAFGMFDLDGSGVIEVHEMKELVAHVWGDHWESNVRVQRIIDNLEDAKDSSITFADFQSFNKRYPALLMPAFLMQESMRDQLYGARWWDMITEERSASGGARSDSIFELLGKLNDDALKDRLVQMIDEIKGFKDL